MEIKSAEKRLIHTLSHRRHVSVILKQAFILGVGDAATTVASKVKA